MRNLYLSALALSLCISSLTAQNNVDFEKTLDLRNGQFVINRAENNALTKSEVMDWPSFQNQHYGVVLLDQNISLAKQEYFKTQGISFLESFKKGFYLLSINANVSETVLSQLNIIGQDGWANKFKAIDDLSIVPNRARINHQTVLVNLHSFKNISTEDFLSSLTEKNLAIVDNRTTYQFVTIETSLEKIAQIKEITSVQYIDWAYDYGEPENYTGRTAHRVNMLSTENTNGIGYEGQGVAVMLQDDGSIGPHIDRHNRETQFWVGSEGDHGDHVSGTILGAGNIDPRGQGQAPQADLFVYKAAPEYQGFDSIMQHYYDYDVVITSTSYSNGCNAGYTALARTMDDQIQQRPSLMHVFSAGNSGTSNCGYGAGSFWGNITGGHKVGKNVITVANLDENDIIANSSSRGPAHDGRIKPDISAKGSSVYSTIENYDYGVKSGTSMSCPGVSGSLAVLYSAFEGINGIKPEAGLMKAIVLNTADDIGVVGPDFIHGWGRINVAKAYEDIENASYLEGTVADGDSVEFSLNIPAGLHQAKIMLYWTDPEASTGASTALINDLDFTIIDANSSLLLPLVLDPTPNAATLGNAAVPGTDHLNNVEQIVIDQPTNGVYTLKIKGFDVSQGPQKFFISCRFEEAKISLTYPIGSEHFVPFSSEKLRWDVSPDTGTVIAEYSTDNGATWNLINNAAASQKYINWNIPNITTGEVKVRLSYSGQAVESEALSIIATPNGLNALFVCPDSIGLTWNNANGATSYNVYRLGNKYMDSIGISQTNTFVEYGVNPYSDFLWYSVSSNGPNSAEGQRAYAYQIQPGLFNCIIPVDAELSDISPDNGSLSDCHGDSVEVSFKVFNNGTIPITSISAWFDLSGASSTQNFTLQLSPNTDTLLVFDQKASVQAGNNLTVWINTPSDGNHYNDTANISFQSLASTTMSQAIWTEDFENFTNCSTESSCGEVVCNLINGWHNEENYLFDDADWRTNNGGTPSDFTGPTADHTSGTSTGKYLYVEASGTCTDAVSTLLSPCIELAAGGKPELVFWYSMRGADMGSLHVDVFDGSSWSTDVMLPIVGDQSNSWVEKIIDLSDFTGKTINLRFRAITGNGYRSDFAIDDIGIRQPPIANFTAQVQGNGNSVSLTDLSSYADNMVFDLGDGTILGAVPASHTYNQVTVYSITQEVYNAAGADTMTLELNTLGIDGEENHIQITTYPVPTRENITVELPITHKFKELTLISVDGTIIETVSTTHKNKILIDLSKYAAGVYFIDLKGDETARLQFIKID